MGVDLGQAVVDLADTLGRRVAFGLVEQPGTFDIGGKHRIQQAVLAARRLLRDRGDGYAPREPDGTAVGLRVAQDQAQHRRLAGAVAPDQRDPRARRDRRRYTIEDRASGDAIAQFIDHQHRAIASD